MVERAGAHAQQDFSGAGDRIRDRRELRGSRVRRKLSRPRLSRAHPSKGRRAARQAPFFSAPWKVAESSEIISSFLRITSSSRWRSFSQSEKRASVAVALLQRARGLLGQRAHLGAGVEGGALGGGAARGLLVETLAQLGRRAPRPRVGGAALLEPAADLVGLGHQRARELVALGGELLRARVAVGDGALQVGEARLQRLELPEPRGGARPRPRASGRAPPRAGR